MSNDDRLVFISSKEVVDGADKKIMLQNYVFILKHEINFSSFDKKYANSISQKI